MSIREIVGAKTVIATLPPLAPEPLLAVTRAVLKAGLRVLEINLQGQGAVTGIDAVRKSFPDAVLGVSGLSKPADFAAAGRIGAHYGVTPGLTAEIAAATRGARFPVMPGVMTPSDVIAAQLAGFKVLSLFPAELAGGLGLLETLGGCFPELQFYASGAIPRDAAPRYLQRANVAYVAGTWLVPAEMIRAADWRGVEALARDAAALATP